MYCASLKQYLSAASVAVLTVHFSVAAHAQNVPPDEARAIAKEAYTYGYPLVDGYRILNAYFVNNASPEYKSTWNQLVSTPRVYTPEDKAIQTPNSDTPYSTIGLDLRAEPMVLTVPKIEEGRYFSIQLIDTYTHNFDYIGSRTTGNSGGSFLVAGPSWSGDVPEGITKVFVSETELVLAVYRTQLFNPDELDQVKAIQDQYRAEPLSTFLNEPAPATSPAIKFPAALTPETQKSSLEFFNILNFVLQLGPTHPSEAELMERFAKIGVGAGLKFDVMAMSPEIVAAIEAGRADALAELANLLATEVASGTVTSGDLLGSRETLKNNYLYRMAGATVGIYGNSRDEAIYPIYAVDIDGRPLDGTTGYTLHFAESSLPPVNGFWSITMYEMPSSLLYANPLKRYLLNTPMLPEFQRDGDGGLTFYIQHNSPGADLEANWLPAPRGPFMVVMRLYWPSPEALDGTWVRPEMVRAN